MAHAPGPDARVYATRDLPRPDYAAAADSDWLGSRAVEVMLEDLDFPLTARELNERAGEWQVPVKGSDVTVPLRVLLEPFDEDKRFRSARATAAAIARGTYRF